MKGALAVVAAPTGLVATADGIQKRRQFIQNIKRMRELVVKDQLAFMKVEGGSTTLSNEMILSVYDDIIKMAQRGGLDGVKPGDGKYFKRDIKEQNALNSAVRSYAVVCNENGEFELYLEPKSKFTFNLKRIISWRGGSFKSCKLAFRIDCFPFVPCASLVSKIDQPDLKYDEDEHNRNQQMFKVAPECFCGISRFVQTMGSKFIVRRYMQHVQFDLFSLMQKGIFDSKSTSAIFPGLKREPVTIGKEEFEHCKLDIIWQLLNAISKLEGAGICHRDIKPENILIQFDPVSKRPLVRIIDLGLSSEIPYKLDGSGTLSYMPPEIFWNDYHELRKFGDKTTVSDILARFYSKSPSYALQLVISNLTSGNESTPEPAGYKSQHDSWSLGILIYELLNGKRPDANDRAGLSAFEAKFKDTPFTSLLDPDPRTRIPPSEAMKMLEDKMDPTTRSEICKVPVIKTDAAQYSAIALTAEESAFIDAMKNVTNFDKTFDSSCEEIKSYLTRIPFAAANKKIIDNFELNLKALVSAITDKNIGHISGLLNEFREIRMIMAIQNVISRENDARSHALQLAFTILFDMAKIYIEKSKPKPNKKKVDGMTNALITQARNCVAAMHMQDREDFSPRFGKNPKI